MIACLKIIIILNKQNFGHFIDELLKIEQIISSPSGEKLEQTISDGQQQYTIWIHNNNTRFSRFYNKSEAVYVRRKFKLTKKNILNFI